MYHCPFQGKSLADNVDKVGYRSDPNITRVSLNHAFMTTCLRFIN